VGHFLDPQRGQTQKNKDMPLTHIDRQHVRSATIISPLTRNFQVSTGSSTVKNLRFNVSPPGGSRCVLFCPVKQYVCAGPFGKRRLASLYGRVLFFFERRDGRRWWSESGFGCENNRRRIKTPHHIVWLSALRLLLVDIFVARAECCGPIR